MARGQLKQKKKPLIVICSEGGKKSSEYYYFRNFATRDLRVQFSTGNSTDPKGMLKELKDYIKNEDIESEDDVRIFLVLDTDLDSRKIQLLKDIKNQCSTSNIEIITSAPTFEIWYIMHYRNNKLIFNSSRDVKNELKTIIGSYTESMNVYKIICDKTEMAKEIAKKIEYDAINNGEEIISRNPHTDIYKIIDVIEKYNKKI